MNMKEKHTNFTTCVSVVQCGSQKKGEEKKDFQGHRDNVVSKIGAGAVVMVRLS